MQSLTPSCHRQAGLPVSCRTNGCLLERERTLQTLADSGTSSPSCSGSDAASWSLSSRTCFPRTSNNRASAPACVFRQRLDNNVKSEQESPATRLQAMAAFRRLTRLWQVPAGIGHGETEAADSWAVRCRRVQRLTKHWPAWIGRSARSDNIHEGSGMAGGGLRKLQRHTFTYASDVKTAPPAFIS